MTLLLERRVFKTPSKYIQVMCNDCHKKSPYSNDTYYFVFSSKIVPVDKFVCNALCSNCVRNVPVYCDYYLEVEDNYKITTYYDVESAQYYADLPKKQKL